MIDYRPSWVRHSRLRDEQRKKNEEEKAIQ
jgi:hypothetical protein